MDIEELLARMTLDEKLAQLGCVWSTQLVEDECLLDARPRSDCSCTASARSRASARPPGCGPANAPRSRTRSSATSSSTRASGSPRSCTKRAPRACARATRRSSRRPSASRPPGTRISLERIAAVIRAQMTATGARHSLAPVLDIARDPRWGRTEETYGESPYLAARLGVAYVRGLQGDLADGVAATAKHFLGYGLSEGGMNHAPVHLGPRELREVYAEPFRAAISEAGLATVMNSYASVDGVACGGSKLILDDLLRGELGFTGAVVADYFTTAAAHQPSQRRGNARRSGPARARGRSRHGAAGNRVLRSTVEGPDRIGRGRCRARRSVGATRPRAQAVIGTVRASVRR